MHSFHTKKLSSKTLRLIFSFPSEKHAINALVKSILIKILPCLFRRVIISIQLDLSYEVTYSYYTIDSDHGDIHYRYRCYFSRNTMVKNLLSITATQV